MALTVEDGTGLTNADSYVSLADANTYMSVYPDTTAWDALADADKENYLRMSTRVLDANSDYSGTKVYEDGILRWPRMGVCDKDGYLVDSDIVPVPVANATTELARILLTQVDITSEQTVDYLKKIQVDVVMIEYQNSVSQPKFTQFINGILNPFGIFQTGPQGYGRIKKT